MMAHNVTYDDRTRNLHSPQRAGADMKKPRLPTARGRAADEIPPSPVQSIQRASEILKRSSFVAEVSETKWRVTADLPDGRRYHVAEFAAEASAREWIRQGAQNWLKNRLREELKPVRYRIAPKYCSPDGNTWSGRGCQPGWLARALREGKSLDDFLVIDGGGWMRPDDHS